MLMMRPALPGGARYRGCRTANIRHLDFDASFWFWTPKMMHHFDFGQRSNDAPCRLVWTYGGLVTKIGSGGGCLCQQMWKKRNRCCCLSKKRNPLTSKKWQKSGQNFRSLSFFLFHSVTSWHCNSYIQYPISDVAPEWVKKYQMLLGLMHKMCFVLELNQNVDMI